MASSTSLRPLEYGEKFREYQATAIAMAREYRLNVAPSTARDEAAGAALVCHPTGTGKTAVIAGLAHCAPEIGSVLVLTTRQAVRDQLVRELGGNLFIDESKFNLGAGISLRKMCYAVTQSRDLDSAELLFTATKKLLPEELSAFADAQFGRLVGARKKHPLARELARGNTILVMTVQMLVELQRERSPAQQQALAALNQKIDLVIFDEGHYEPAAKFSGAVRGLKKPIVLLTATPFRNDLKAFHIDQSSNIDIYKYRQASEVDKVIRKVQVVVRDPAPTEEAFCDDIIAYCTGLWGDHSTWKQRVIIHCDDMPTITRLGEAFIARGFGGKVVGIHDKYPPATSKDAWRRQSVPRPGESDASIWIHQYKLLEGIDDHRFQVLAFFDLLKNVRSVVQQIGRVIRKGGNDTGTAWVLDHFRGRIDTYWEQYKQYDDRVDADELAKSMSKLLIDDFTSAQPENLYIDRKFRSRMEVPSAENEVPVLTPAQIADEILFDRRVTFKKVAADVTLELLTTDVEEALTAQDYQFTRYDVSAVSPDTVIYLCARVDNVGFLNTRYYALPQLEARLLMLLPTRRLIATTSTGSGSGADGLSHLTPVAPEKLRRLVIPGDQGRISQVSSRNTNLSNRVVRRRTISAPSIADVPPILDEYGHVVSTVTGYNGTTPQVFDDIDYQEQIDDDETSSSEAPRRRGQDTEIRLIRRYVGMSSGRVSEQGDALRVRAYRQWIEALVRQMQSTQKYSEVYGRYANLARSTVRNRAASNLLLDITDLSDQFRHKPKRDNTEGDTDDRKPENLEFLRSDELCVDRQGDVTGTSDRPVSHFEVWLNDTKYDDVRVTYNSASKRYSLESPRIDADFVPEPGPRQKPLVRVLNETQSFNVIPDDPNVIYVHGGFYAPGLKIGERFQRDEFFVGHCLYPGDTFKKIKTEKGIKVLPDDRYDPDSLFGLIDQWAREGFDTEALALSTWWLQRYRPETVRFAPTLCICDDMQSETADFILVDEDKDRRAVLVHAKASGTYRKFSASAVQEICAQAQKNTALFSTFSLQEPPNLTRWDEPHIFAGRSLGKGRESLTIQNRMRLSKWPNARAAWDRSLSQLLRNPQLSKEIWLVLGNMVSARGLYEELRKDTPRPESLQLNHLLQTTIAAAASVGAKTRIFCAP